MKMGERAVGDAGFSAAPTSVRLIMGDIVEHPGSAVGEITARTGFPQSHVSASVAKLREAGVVETETDPRDRRRTLVRAVSGVPERWAERMASVPIENAVAATLGTDEPVQVAEVITLLDALLDRFEKSHVRRVRQDADQARQIIGGDRKC
ncbi:MAG: MarR family transcriptional regulator [Streptosporangiales bacterium]|nr:MarR family transcriptional regulator [Streptosporangiales bacterium]